MSSDRIQSAPDTEKLWDLVKDIHIAMFTTKEPDGTLRARPMATQQPDKDGFLWFFTRIDSGKTSEIDRDHEVQISYADGGASNYVSVTGYAEIVQDRAKIEALWKPMLNAWFEEGKDDPQIGLVKVTITSAEYWSGPSNKVARLFGMAKAAVTRNYDQGEHGKVEVY